MTEPAFNLANPPIIEAVLDIDCDLAKELDMDGVEKLAFPLVKDQYPKVRKNFRQQVKANMRHPEKTSVEGSVQAIQFLHQDGKQIVQIRREGFSFNRLAPYRGLDSYLSEIERLWKVCIPILSPRQIKAIRLRYINRIPLPTVDNNVDLNDYMTVGSSVPPGVDLSVMGFLNQYVATDVKTGNVASVVITTQPQQDDKMPVIFDITATCPNAIASDNWPAIAEKIHQLRLLKNSVFKNTLTPKCLSLFH